MRPTALVVAVALLGCGAPASEGARTASLSPAAAPVSSVRPVRFVEDDYPSALAEARRTGKLLFVDAWAPWCHSCLSMRAYVLGDPALGALDARFVWLSVDTEKETNARFVERFPNDVWPTLWVIDPAREEARLSWPGTATASELVALLRAVDAPGAPDAGRAEVAFLQANKAAARGDAAAAAKQYLALLAGLDATNALTPRVVEGAVGALAKAGDPAACATLAASRADAMPSGTSRATVVALGLSCARQAKLGDELAKVLALAEKIATGGDPQVLADDRSALFEEIVETHERAHDTPRVKAWAALWAAFLEKEAAAARTPAARAVFDAHRLSAYLALGDPARALPMLEASERDFPADYNPPARRARALLELGRLDEARAAVDRAAARVYGPRALRVLALAADIAHVRTDAPAERAALDQALARTEKAQLTAGQQKLREELRARREALGKPGEATR